MSILVTIPIFNSLAAVARCLESLREARTRANYRVLLINDASTEATLALTLDKFAQRTFSRGAMNVQVRHNRHNRGFTWNVNQAITALRPGEDLLLLNSDTLVTDGWIDELDATAKSDAKIGTVTPFSNNATICSLPDFTQVWPVPNADARSAIAQALVNPRAEAIDIPTAVGFCMLINRDCVEAVGPFDTFNFPRGYGEENDFSMRAAQLGFRNVLCPNAYVAHEGGLSFGDEKQGLMREGGERLSALYPEYNATVAAWIEADPAKKRRSEFTAALANLKQTSKAA